MTPHLILDFETRSELDLKKVGIYKYMSHPSTRILWVAAIFGDYAGKFSDMDKIPNWLFDALDNPDVEVHAHNATVERLAIQRICTPRHGWSKVATHRFRCSATRVARMALPRSLDKSGHALGLPKDLQKDKAGTMLIRQLCKPTGYSKEEGFVYNDDPVKMRQLGDYCYQDVVAEKAVEDATFPMPRSEEDYYQLTERINDRGIRVDMPLVKRLIWRANECVEDLNNELSEITDGEVTALTQVAKLKTWVEEETGVKLATMRKEDMEEWFVSDDEMPKYSFPKHVIRALKIRQEGAKSSVSKLVAIHQRAMPDGKGSWRIYGAFVMNGASTGRYTSMGVQLQNLVRDGHKDWAEAIKRLDKFSLTDISKCIRGCFIPEEGCVYVDADYNAIEARGVGWLAGAKKLVRIYQTGGDPYCEMGSVIYSRIITKADEWERFVGKQTILGCGYGMGAQKFFDQCIKFGKPVEMEIAEKAIKSYRTEYPEIPQLWGDIEKAAIRATRNKGTAYSIPNGKITFLYKDGYLQMKLPNGRRLFYKDARVRSVDKWGNGREQDQLSFMAEDPKTHQWVRETTWGGKLTENAVQALCRDLLFEAMLRIDDEGVDLVLSVHDQLVSEVANDNAQWAIKVVRREMEKVPEWAYGFPVTAEPKLTERFGK